MDCDLEGPQARRLALLLDSLNLLFSWIVSDSRLSRFVPASNTVLSTVVFESAPEKYSVYHKESVYVLDMLCVLYRLKSASKKISQELASLIPKAVFNRRWLRLYFEEYRSQLTRMHPERDHTNAVLLVDIEDDTSKELKFGFVNIALSSWLKHCGPGIDMAAIRNVTFNKTTQCARILEAICTQSVNNAAAASSINLYIKEATRQMMQYLLGVFPQNRTMCFVNKQKCNNGEHARAMLNMRGLALRTCVVGICRNKNVMRGVRSRISSVPCMELFARFLAGEEQEPVRTAELIWTQLNDLEASIKDQKTLMEQSAVQQETLLGMRMHAWGELECWKYLICPHHCFNNVVTCHLCAKKIPYCELSANIQSVQLGKTGPSKPPLRLERDESPGIHSPDDHWYIKYSYWKNQLVVSQTVPRTLAACEWVEQTHRVAYHGESLDLSFLQNWVQTSLTVFGVANAAKVISDNFYWGTKIQSAMDTQEVFNMFHQNQLHQLRNDELKEQLKCSKKQIDELKEQLSKRQKKY